jgi:Ca2+-transporting ATPase
MDTLGTSPPPEEDVSGGDTGSDRGLSGLTADEASERLVHHGPNLLPEAPAPSPVRRVLRSLRDPLVLVLLTALALTLLTDDLSDATVIALVIIVNSAIGVRQEIQADQAVRALSAMVATQAWVVRSGGATKVAVADLVPGDLLRLRQGELVPADAVLVDGPGLQVDESTLTGESLPVDKQVGRDPGPGVDGPPPEPKGSTGPTGPATDSGTDARLLSGSVVLRGRGLARVTVTGAGSSVGRIAGLMVGAPPATPLQRRMARLSTQLAAAAVALSCVVLVIGLARGQGFEQMVLSTIALVVAAVPESLPLVVTVSLAIAARRMAARHAVVRNLAAVETLGSVTLLATDKTGTLTRGSMTVRSTWQPAGVGNDVLQRALVLCSDAALDAEAGHVHADPTEEALLRAATLSAAETRALRTAYPRTAESPFDSVRKRMSTTHRGPGGELVTWHKGAPESILREDWLADDDAAVAAARSTAQSWAQGGRRVIAVAVEDATGRGATRPGPHLVGLVGLEDPVRESSRATVDACRDAGIRVVLITGDHPATADAIAGQVGIGDGRPPTSLADEAVTVTASLAAEATVLARATPADKHALVTAFQAAGHVVAMTGDGVNDAPALRQADIGVAMGVRGSEVARQAADLVLTDDELGTVVAAVEEGRRVFANIRRFLTYGLSGGGSEVLLMLVGPFLGTPLPLLPAQILWLNLLTHSFAGAGLAAQPADPAVLHRGPRSPESGLLGGGLGWRTGLLAAALATAASVAIVVSPVGTRQTAALLVLGAGQLGVAWGLRTARRAGSHGSGVDPLLPLILLAGTMLVSATLVPPLRNLLDTVAIGADTWALVGLSGVAAWALTRLVHARAS